MIDRVSLSAEQAAVGAVILNSELFDDVIEIAEISDFTSPAHREILKKVAELREKFGAADSATVCVELGDPDQIAYAAELAANTPTTANAKAYATIVKERSQFRAVDSAVREAADGVNAAETPQEAAEAAQSRISALDLSKGEDAIQTASQAAKEMVKNLEERFQAKSRGELGGLSTGLKDIDKRLDGLRPGNFIVVAGRPGMGKSVYGISLSQAASMSQGKNVLFFSLEMPSSEVIERMVSSVGKIPYSKIRDASCFDDYNQELVSAVGKVKNASIKIIETPSIHINQIKSYSRKVHRKEPVGLVVVDHISIASGDGPNREREMASITGGLKALAKELKCPVVGLCQLNRSVESEPDKKPQMKHLRDSGSIEQDADVIQLLWREEYYDPETNNKGVLEVNTAKFRGGILGRDYVAAQFHQMTVADLFEFTPEAVSATGSYKPKSFSI